MKYITPLIITAAILLLTSCRNYKLAPGNYFKYHHFHNKAPKQPIADSTKK